jgi:PUA domain protein
LTPGAKSKVKSSAQRAIRAKAIETYPRLEPYMDEIMPKKEQIDLVKVYVCA